MQRTPLLADLERAFDLLTQVDESHLDFSPDPNVTADVQAITGLNAYPVDSHRANLQARIKAVQQAGDKLDPREPSEYVSQLIVACARLVPVGDN